MSETKFTPTPWHVSPETMNTWGDHPRIFGAAERPHQPFGKLVACVGNAEDQLYAGEEWDANAELIVRAVNSYASRMKATEPAALEAALEKATETSQTVIIDATEYAALLATLNDARKFILSDMDARAFSDKQKRLAEIIVQRINDAFRRQRGSPR